VADRASLLDMSGPRTVKEVEALVFLAARGDPQFEACHRTWLADDRSWFIRWRQRRVGSPLQIIGLVHAFQLPEMASRVSLLPFGDDPAPALRRYAERLKGELEAEGFT
jgi:hypothetical protein